MEDRFNPDPMPGRASFAEVLFKNRIDVSLTKENWNKANEHHLFYISQLIDTYEKLQKVECLVCLFVCLFVCSVIRQCIYSFYFFCGM